MRRPVSPACARPMDAGKLMDTTIDLAPDDIARFGPDPESVFRTNLAAVESRISHACARAGRERASVRLLPITKTVPAHVLRLAFQAGIRDFGENKIQEAKIGRASWR